MTRAAQADHERRDRELDDRFDRVVNGAAVAAAAVRAAVAHLPPAAR